MDLPDLKALDKIIALCRKRGVKSIKIDNVELTLSEDAPAPKAKKGHYEAAGIPAEDDSWESLSDEEKLFYSAGGLPWEPDAKDNT